jgi:hypothetical protein
MRALLTRAPARGQLVVDPLEAFPPLFIALRTCCGYGWLLALTSGDAHDPLPVDGGRPRCLSPSRRAPAPLDQAPPLNSGRYVVTWLEESSPGKWREILPSCNCALTADPVRPRTS